MNVLASAILITMTIGAVAWSWLALETLALARAAIEGADLIPVTWRQRFDIIAPPAALCGLGLLVLWA